MCRTLVEYLSRAGFHVFFDPEGEKTLGERLALAGSVSDFVVFLPPAGFVLPGGSRDWEAEAATALGAGRNVVRVSLAGERAWTPVASGLDGAAFARLQSLTYDPDRLAESLSLIQHCLSTDTIVNDRRLSRRWQRWFAFAGALVLLGFSAQTIPLLIEAWNRPRPPPPVAPFVLYWSGFAEREVAGVTEEFPLVPGAEIRPGDRLRVAFSPSADGFAYVVAKDGRGRVVVLFPGETIKAASRVKAGQSYSAPVPGGWLTVDADAGLDTLYVFGSYDPLQNLEELVEEPETINSLGARRELVESTVNGLLDGKHHPPGPRIWIRSTALVDQGKTPGAGPESFAASSPGGRRMTHQATRQPGLVNALAEIKLRFSK